MTRALVRGILAVAVLVFTWYALGQIQNLTPAAPYLALIAAALLLLLARAARIRSSRG